MMRVAIVTPTYNEAGNIKLLITKLEKVCQAIPENNFSVLVVDDSSPDGTAKVARALAKRTTAKNFAVRVLVRPKKEGVGKAYVHAFKEILKEKFDYIIQIDADLSHNPKYVEALVEEAEKGRDFIATSRYMKGGAILDWDLRRRLLSRGGNIYTRFFLGSKITDYTNGLNMFSTDLLRTIDMDTLESGGYGFFIELKYRALKHTKNFIQIPIVLTDRQHGQSKLPKNTLRVNLLLVPQLRFSRKK
jgi:dolichol-phosphate mannosyltransferase